MFAGNNGIESSKFPRGPQAISRRLNKIKSNLREGLGIEVIVDRIISGKGNKKYIQYLQYLIKKKYNSLILRKVFIGNKNKILRKEPF